MSALPADRGPPPHFTLPAGAEASTQHPRSRNRRGRGRRRNSPHPDTSNNVANSNPAAESTAGDPSGSLGSRRNRGPRQERSGQTGGETHPEDGASAGSTGSHTRPRRGRGRGNQNAGRGAQAPGRGGRRQQFGARLTDGGSQATAPISEPVPPPPTSGDLTSRLIYSLTHKEDAVDCPICFNPVHPSQPIWSCTPPPINPLDDASTAPVTCCWTIFHMKCIKEWARKSVAATREAYRARNVDLPGEWRCPGCQTKRTVVPQAYTCFCGRMTDPALSRLSTPHSCGEPCARVRKECDHACPMACHPGPCPPCLVSVSKDCWCGSKTIVSRCSVLNKGTSINPTVGPVLSCGQSCGRLLGCEKHTCQQECHPGLCTPCQIVDIAKCYCGKREKEMPCGTGSYVDCTVEGEKPWEGRWQCEETCDR
jgi:transcriptional repressor NF-X1